MFKDKFGNKVVQGNVLISWWGGGGGEQTYSIWEMPNESVFDGEGYQYSIDGKKHKVAWFYPKQSMKILPWDGINEFVFSFRHGMDSFNIKDDDLKSSHDVIEVINKSDWKEHIISKVEIKSYKKLKSLRLMTVEDIISNIGLLKSRYVPHEVVVSVIQICGREESKVINGELGMANLNDMLMYSYILSILDEK